MWTRHKQPQHCGAQLPVRERVRQTGAAPDAAIRDRAAQEHERAGDDSLPPGDYPASRLDDGARDNTPAAAEASVDWDAVVQPERDKVVKGNAPRLPEGK